MAKLTLTDLTSLTNETSAIATINANSQLIEEAMDKTVFRDGETPNTMAADFDLNSNDILNVNNIDAQSLTIAGSDDPFSSALEAAADAEESAAEAETAKNNAETAANTAATEATAAGVSAAAALVSETNAADSANTAQAAAAGIFWKEPVLNRTTANITLSGEQTIDGVLTSASRILVMNQTAASENGIYVTDAGAWARATPMDTWDEHVGATVNVSEGTTYADTSWICTVDAGGTLETTDITFGSLGAVYSSATTTTEGVIELATDAEVATGTDTSRAVTSSSAAAHYSPIERVTNDDTSTALNLAASDSGNIIFMNNAAANVLTIQTNATTPIDVDTQVDIAQEGAGATTVTAASGVTLNNVVAGSLTLSAQFSGGTLVKRATDTWVFIGDHGGVA